MEKRVGIIGNSNFFAMMNETQYQRLRDKYGDYSSWAIWNHEDEGDPTIIESHVDELNTRRVIIALNVSWWWDYPSGYWANFRGGSHSRKLKEACNDTELRGSYLTDLFKNIEEADSNKLRGHLTPDVIEKNVTYFFDEMSGVGVGPETEYIVLGGETKKLFNKYFLPRLGCVNVKYYTHYSYYGRGGTDKEWVEGLWKELGIKANYETIHQKYK